MNTISTHCIDGALGAPHGREVTDLIKPTNDTLIGRSGSTRTAPIVATRTARRPFLSKTRTSRRT
jgi:hypothetical protein